MEYIFHANLWKKAVLATPVNKKRDCMHYSLFY